MTHRRHTQVPWARNHRPFGQSLLIPNGAWFLLSRQPRRPGKMNRAPSRSTMRWQLSCVFTSPDPLEAVEGIDDLLGFGAGAVVGVDVDPPDGATGVEDDGGGHRQGDGAVGVDAGQVESEVQLGGAGLG